MLEKATRVVTAEERALMDQDFVGKNGEKRKIEVHDRFCDPGSSCLMAMVLTFICLSVVYLGATEAQEIPAI